MKFKFIEIGTSNFNTMAHDLNKGRIKLEDDFWGMSIEPMNDYLEQLPENKKLVKVNCAIVTDDKKQTEKFYYVSPKTISEQKFVNGKSLRGSNSVGTPHILHTNYMEKHNDYFCSDVEDINVFKTRNLLEEGLVTVEDVKCLTWGKLVEEHNIEFVEHIKIDAEGMDMDIVESILLFYSNNGQLKHPKMIDFEVNKTVPLEKRSGKAWSDFLSLVDKSGYSMEKIALADYRITK
tara:strand:- start:23821 stop:24525 length:705 start_codon:yes stop_codon:yes gene_type:complete